EYFVHTTKTIDYGIKSVFGIEGKTIVQLEKADQMPMPLDVVVEYNDGSAELFYIPLKMMRGEKPAENDMKRTVLEDWPWVNPDYTFTINKPATSVKKITIDPSLRMADINMQNNVFEVAKIFE